MDATFLADGPRLLVSRAALLHNADVIRKQLPPGVRICAVVKADAYGHGAALVVDALSNIATDDVLSPAVDQLAVATLDEAHALGNISVPVLILRAVEDALLGHNREAIELAIGRGWILTLAHGGAADDIARIATRIQKRALIHVMIDTGMTRCGACIDSLPALLRRIDAHPSLQLLSLSTHFANSEVRNDRFTTEQLRRFLAATEVPMQAYNGKVIRHAANSGGVFFTPSAHFDMVRPGIALYGIDPTGKPTVDRALRPAAKLVANLLAVHEVRGGTSIGYGQAYKAPRNMRVGLVPVGYADGLMRCLSDGGMMLVEDEPCPIVGRISMDLTTIDLSEVPGARIGDVVTVIDNDPLSPASIYSHANHAKTIPYELLTRIGSRIKRVGIDPSDAQLAIPEELTDELDTGF